MNEHKILKQYLDERVNPPKMQMDDLVLVGMGRFFLDGQFPIDIS